MHEPDPISSDEVINKNSSYSIFDTYYTNGKNMMIKMVLLHKTKKKLQIFNDKYMKLGRFTNTCMRFISLTRRPCPFRFSYRSQISIQQPHPPPVPGRNPSPARGRWILYTLVDSNSIAKGYNRIYSYY